ncbi:MAG: integrase family protein, partial [Frankiales bacterium]|nr:integrase family protein [Frankiales bacterium]
IEERLTRNVARDVAVPAALTPAKPPRRLTRGERDALLGAVRSDRMFGLYYVMYALGLRRGEAIGLRISDADFDNRVLRVEQQIVRVTGGGLQIQLPKGRKTRRLWMSETTERVLRARLAERAKEAAACAGGWVETGLIFTTGLGTPLDPSRLNHHMTALCAEAGIAHATPHSLRRTFSDDAHALGVRDKELQQAMGHSRIGMTMDTYVDTKPGTDAVFAAMIDSSLPDLDGLLADTLADTPPAGGIVRVASNDETGS